MPYPQTKPEDLKVYPLCERKSKSQLKDILFDPEEKPESLPAELDKIVEQVAERIYLAREKNASVMLAFGAHLVKNGNAAVLIKLMEKGWITHLATNGAGGIHDWEFAFQAKSEEDVRANVKTGTFGTWDETGKYINLAVQLGAVSGMGYGESLGAIVQNDCLQFPEQSELEYEILEGIRKNDPYLAAKVELLETIKKFNLSGEKLVINHPHKKYSIAGSAYLLKVPLTIHPGIGYDIIYNNPFANGAALGRGAHIDYNIFVNSVKNLTNGVFLSIGSAIMAPQVFEKALSAANNVLLRKNDKVENHYILVDDLQESVWDWTKGEPPKESPDYYLRFLKSFNRMGGEIKYISLDNRLLLHNLYYKLEKS